MTSDDPLFIKLPPSPVPFLPHGDYLYCIDAPDLMPAGAVRRYEVLGVAMAMQVSCLRDGWLP